eukprot:CFRG2851T1
MVKQSGRKHKTKGAGAKTVAVSSKVNGKVVKQEKLDVKKGKKKHQQKVLLKGQVVELREQIDDKFIDLRHQGIEETKRRKAIANAKPSREAQAQMYKQQEDDMADAINAMSNL